MSPVARVLVGCAALFVAASARAGPPPVELADGGRTILYRVQANDTPDAMAQAFGLDQQAFDALRAAHGARDWTRVRAGAVWAFANPLAAPLDALRGRVAGLEAEVAAATARLALRGSEIDALRTQVRLDDAQRARLDRLEQRWWGAVAAAALLGIGCVAAVLAAFGVRRREQRAVRWAQALSTELDERRRGWLRERQQAARRQVELEERLRHVELRHLGAGGPHVRLVERSS